MTLVLSVHGRRTLWVVADRRLSYDGTREPRDDAIKLMELSATDGIGIIGYAGLGSTGRGTQPSEWMSAVLRGRGELSFMHSLQALANAATKELPRHLRSTSTPTTHTILASAFLRGVGARTFSIRNVFPPAHHKSDYRVFSHQRTNDPGSASTHLTAVGSGRDHLQDTFARWSRDLRRRVNAHDQGSVSDLAVADFLAGLNHASHLNTQDRTVGPRCIVVWRTHPDLLAKRSGGGHQFYSGKSRENDTVMIPTIGQGRDIKAIIQPLWNDLLQSIRAWSGDEDSLPDMTVDIDDMNRRLAELPTDPDEKLR